MRTKGGETTALMSMAFLRRTYYQTGLYNRRLNKHACAGLTPLSTDPMPGDPSRGAAILSGRFLLPGSDGVISPDPWETIPAHAIARDALHGFEWLRDLAALGPHSGREMAQKLVRQWLGHFDKWTEEIWSTPVTALRLLSWIDQGKYLTEGAGDGFSDDFRRSLTRQARHLENASPAARTPAAAGTMEAVALAAAGLALKGQEDLLATGLARLETAVTGEIHADGGHMSHNPELHLKHLARLAALRNGLRTRGEEVPVFLQAALDRMTPVLRALCHGDGRLALFNGGCMGDSAQVAAVLAAVGHRGKPLNSMPQTGYERLSNGRTTIIADAGGNRSESDVHAGLLAFEMSSGRHRMIVNCGAHPDLENPWSEPLCSTAAHSTVVIDDTNSRRLSNRAKNERAETASTGCRRNERDRSILIQMTHNGYRERFGVTHNRDLYLSDTGEDFRGKDVILGDAGHDFAVRFHLHPDVKASMLQGGHSVLIRLSNGHGWRFRSSGGAVDLEESIYLGDLETPRRAQQIVVSGRTETAETTVKWSFLRDTK